MEIDIKTEAKHSDGQIKTLDDLVTEAQVDLNVWTITKVVLNKWDMGAKDPTGEVVVTPLFQVKILLEPKIHVSLEVAHGTPLGPTVVNAAPYFKEPGIESALFLPDCQIGYEWNDDYTYLNPFHDRQAMDVALQYAQYMQPNIIVILGDYLDLPTFSRFEAGKKNHKYTNTTQAAIEEGYYYLRSLRERCPKSRIIFIKGNHDIRLARMMETLQSEINVIRPAGEKESQLQIQNLLRFAELGIETNENYDRPVFLWDKICIRHGEEYGKLDATKLAYTTVQGHTHNVVYASKNILTPYGTRTIYMVSPGCLCKTDGTVPAFSKNVQWNQGIGVAYFDTSNPQGNRAEQEHISVLPIHGGSLWENNKVYRAPSVELLAKQAALATGVRQLEMPA